MTKGILCYQHKNAILLIRFQVEQSSDLNSQRKKNCKNSVSKSNSIPGIEVDCTVINISLLANFAMIMSPNEPIIFKNNISNDSTPLEMSEMNGRNRSMYLHLKIRLVQFSKQKQPLARLSSVCTLDPCLYHALFIRRSAGVHVNTFVNISTDFPFRSRQAAVADVRSHSIRYTFTIHSNAVWYTFINAKALVCCM